MRDSQISVISDMSSYKDIQDIAEQFSSSSNELFSEAGNKIRQALSSVGGTKKTSGSNPALDKMIAELTAEINEIKNT